MSGNGGNSRILLNRVTKSWESTDRRFTLFVGSLEIRSETVYLLTGPNGTGKSTLIELLGLASQPQSGDIRLDFGNSDIDVSELWRRRQNGRLATLRARGFGYVMQMSQLIPFLTIWENTLLVQSAAGRRDTRYARALFERLGLSGRESALPQTLSPGLRQRAAIARALAARPQFVLADEPTASLDPEGGSQVTQMLLDLARNLGTGVVLCSHQAHMLDIQDVVRIATVPAPSDDPGHFRSTVEVSGR